MPITVAEIQKNSERLKEPIWILRKRLDLWRAIEEKNPALSDYGFGIQADYTGLDLAGKITEKGASVSVRNADQIDFHKALLEQPYLGILKEHLFDGIEILKNSFWLGLVAAGFATSSFIEIKKTNIRPVRLNIKQKKESALVYVFINVPDETEVDIYEEIIMQEFLGAIIQIHVGANSKVCYYATEENDSGSTLAVMRNASVSSNGSIRWFVSGLENGRVQSAIVSNLVGEKATSEMNVLFFGNGGEQFDLLTQTHHLAPHTGSQMTVKGVLDGESKGIYRGLIKINKEATGSNGYQKEDTLILSKDSEIDAVPNLEIATNDVKCSHGVTTSRLDPEKLFFFTSRGYSEEDARRELIKAHLAPVIDSIPDTKYVKKLEQFIINKSV